MDYQVVGWRNFPENIELLNLKETYTLTSAKLKQNNENVFRAI